MLFWFHDIFQYIIHYDCPNSSIIINRSVIIVVVVVVVVVELTHSKTILQNTVEIEPQPVALDFKNLSQYSSRSK